MVRTGSWCDVVPGGFVRVDAGWVLAEWRDGTLAWRLPEPEPPCLYLRAARVGDMLCAIVQGQGGRAWFTSGVGWQEYGPTYGQNCVLIRAWIGERISGVRVWVQRSKEVYETWVAGMQDTTNETHTFASQGMPEGTSQGFLDVVNGQVLFTDLARVDPPLILPNYVPDTGVGEMAVGQGADVGLFARWQGRTIRVARRHAFEPHVCEERPGGHWVACARSVNNKCVLVKIGKRRWATTMSPEPR